MREEKIKSKFLFNREQRLFLNFIDHTDQADNAVKYINNVIGDKLLGSSKNASKVEYLDIGCGYGYKTQAIESLIKQKRSLNTVALDPSSELLSIYREQNKSKNINFVCSDWESYQPSKKFDFITSIHTFYYMDNWKVQITKMLESLNHQGDICIAIRSNDQVCQFKDYFFNKINKHNKGERNFNELCHTLDTIGVNYKSDIVESKLNISDCLSLNEKGKQLIEFLLRTSYDGLDHDIKKDISNYLEKNHSNNYLAHQDGFVWITH